MFKSNLFYTHSKLKTCSALISEAFDVLGFTSEEKHSMFKNYLFD